MPEWVIAGIAITIVPAVLIWFIISKNCIISLMNEEDSPFYWSWAIAHVIIIFSALLYWGISAWMY